MNQPNELNESGHTHEPDEEGFGWEYFQFTDEERETFFLFAEAGMIAEASEIVDTVYARMFQEGIA